jgi:hypothetical protein
MTIIEVLIAAVIFMIGFSTLILLMNSTLVKFSAKDLLQADHLAHEVMITTLSVQDTTAMDTVLYKSKVAFRIQREIEIKGQLAGVSIIVYRDKQDKKIVELYDAFIIR